MAAFTVQWGGSKLSSLFTALKKVVNSHGDRIHMTQQPVEDAETPRESPQVTMCGKTRDFDHKWKGAGERWSRKLCFAFKQWGWEGKHWEKAQNNPISHGCILFASFMTKWQAKCQIQDEKTQLLQGQNARKLNSPHSAVFGYQQREAVTETPVNNPIFQIPAWQPYLFCTGENKRYYLTCKQEGITI